MAKAARGRSRTARAPRKKKGAVLIVDEPKPYVSESYMDESLRERCYEKALALHTGRETSLVGLLEAAGQLYDFIKGQTLLNLNLGFEVSQQSASRESQNNDGPKQSDVEAPAHHDTNHKSKFEEIAM